MAHIALFVFAFAFICVANATTSVLVAQPTTQFGPKQDAIIFMPANDFSKNTTVPLPYMARLSAKLNAYSPLTSKVVLLGSFISQNTIAYIDISQENSSIATIVSLPGVGNCTVMAMTVGHSVVDESPTETVYIIAMNIMDYTSWGTALLYVSNPRTNEVKLAARLTAPAGFRFEPNNGVAYDAKRHVLWYSAAPLSGPPSNINLAAIDLRSGQAYIPFPNVTILGNEMYDYVSFIYNSSVTGDYLFIDWGYKMSTWNLQNGGKMNELVYADGCWGLSKWPGAIDWTSTILPNSLKCSTFWSSNGCRSTEKVTVDFVYLCNGFAYKGGKIEALQRVNVIAALGV